LNPFRHGAFAWKLWSHKLCRWALPLAVLPAVLGLGLLASTHAWTLWVLLLIVGMGALSIVAANWPDDRLIRAWLPSGLIIGGLGALSANLAVVHSAWRFVYGHQDHVWEPTRRTVPST
jgi:hypothetical protein